jgi:hypothetical protein
MADSFASHRAIIDSWPSLADFAADIGVSYGAAKAMRRRSSIPHDHVSAVVAAAGARGIAGVSADHIAKLAASKSEATNAPTGAGEVVP